MDLDRERIWLAGRLNREDVPDPVWDALEEHRMIDRLSRGELSRAQLTAYAKRLLPYGDFVEAVTEGSEGEQGSEKEPPVLAEQEWDRARVLAEYVALRTAVHKQVQHFNGIIASLELSEKYEKLKDLAHSAPEGWQEQDQQDNELTILCSSLRRYGEDLEKDFESYWNANQFVTFLLTDKVTPRPPLEVRAGDPENNDIGFGRIVIEVEPWVASDTVASFYKYHQRRLLGSRPRPIASHNAALARFVFAQVRRMWKEETERLTKVDLSPESSRVSLWRTLIEAWNQENPDNRYTNERRFYRDFYRAVRSVVRPYGTKEEAYPNAEVPEHSEGEG